MSGWLIVGLGIGAWYGIGLAFLLLNVWRDHNQGVDFTGKDLKDVLGVAVGGAITAALVMRYWLDEMHERIGHDSQFNRRVLWKGRATPDGAQ